MATKRGLQGAAAARIGRRGPATADPASADDPAASAGSTSAGVLAVDPPPAQSGILGALAAAVEQPPAAGERIVEVRVAQLAPHPENVREDMGDVSGIGASIAERGVLQPLVVVTRAAFTAERPDAALDPAAQWVVLAGHRRRAGALAAGVATVPVVVRDALAGDEDAVLSMIVENVQREDLTPVEQARAFGRLRDRDWSERRIATATGVSPGQVHKRLALLRLPAPLVTALTASELTVADALRLLDLPDEQLLPAWKQAQKENWRGLRGVVESRLAMIEAHERAEGLRAALTAAGVETIADPETAFGSEWWHHRLPNDTYAVPGVPFELRGISDTAEAPPSFVVAHVTTHGGRVNLEWFHREPRPYDAPTTGGSPGAGASGGSTPGTSGPGTPALGAPGEDAAAAEERARRLREQQQRAEAARAAAEARADACTRLVTGPLEPELAVEILADAVLVDTVMEPYDAVGLAATFCEVPIEKFDGDDIEDPVSAWLEAQAAAGRLPARRAAVAVALADLENAIGWNAGALEREWSARECRHVRRLAAHGGYDLTPDDVRRFAAADPAAASAGSTHHHGADA